MSDERLRELERRWKETGAVEDEAAYLLERVRSGDLTQGSLEMAAYCGHQAAAFAITGERITPPSSLHEFVVGLATWGKWPSVVAAVAAAVEALPSWSTYVRSNPQREADRPSTAIESANAWIDCPCQAHFQMAVDREPSIGLGMVVDGTEGEAAAFALEAARLALVTVTVHPHERTPPGNSATYVARNAARTAAKAARAAAHAISELPSLEHRQIRRSQPPAASEQRILSVIREALTRRCLERGRRTSG